MTAKQLKTRVAFWNWEEFEKRNNPSNDNSNDKNHNNNVIFIAIVRIDATNWWKSTKIFDEAFVFL